MSKLNIYIGDYLLIEPRSKQESDALAGNVAIIGELLTLDFDPETSAFLVFGRNKTALGVVSPTNPLVLREALAENFNQRIYLTLVAYDPSKKRFFGEVAYQFYKIDPKDSHHEEYFEKFVEKTADQIEAGRRPLVDLGEYGYSKVVDSQGSWFPTGSWPLPELPDGGAVMKRRRSLSDRLMLAAFTHKIGCAIASSLGLLALILLLILIVYQLLL